MFGLMKQATFLAYQKELQEYLESLHKRLNTLSQELHGTQASLYSLISKLGADLVLDDKGQPTVQSRSK